MKERHPQLACHIAGFSFGAWIAMEAANRDHRLASLTTVAPPFKYIEPTFLADLVMPKLFLQGTADDICSPEELRRHYPTVSPPKEVVWFEGAGHFFAHQLDALKAAIAKHRQLLGL
jgi:hypothetical protein